jgi:hypothetical protein
MDQFNLLLCSVRDVKEAALCVKELEAPDFHPTLVSIWVSDSLDKKETERSLLVSLLLHLYAFETPLLTQEEIARGYFQPTGSPFKKLLSLIFCCISYEPDLRCLFSVCLTSVTGVQD